MLLLWSHKHLAIVQPVAVGGGGRVRRLVSVLRLRLRLRRRRLRLLFDSLQVGLSLLGALERRDVLGGVLEVS